MLKMQKKSEARAVAACDRSLIANKLQKRDEEEGEEGRRTRVVGR